VLNSEDAKEMELEEGNRVMLQMKSPAFGGIELDLRTVENTARGICILPRHRRIPWQGVGTGRVWVKKEDIRKVE